MAKTIKSKVEYQVVVKADSVSVGGGSIAQDTTTTSKDNESLKAEQSH